MTSSPHGLYALGCTRATMPMTNRSKTVRWSKSEKNRPSSDCGLQLAHMKLESLVIVDQLCYGECVPEPLYTPPVKSWGSWQCLETSYGATAGPVTGTKS